MLWLFRIEVAGAGRFLGWALLAVAASVTLGSALVSRDAWATAYSPTLLDQAPGGSTTVSGYGVHTVHNSTGTTQRLMGLTPDFNTVVGGSSSCAVGSALAPGGECTLNLVASCAVTIGQMQSGTPSAAKAWGC
nr:midcut-by-XrtH protein [Acidovorax delafieldii]